MRVMTPSHRDDRAPTPSKRAVLTVVDGLRPDAIEDRHAGFGRLARLGASTMAARSVVPSVTLPCHMSIFHSVPPTRHGVTSNVYTPMARPVPGLAEVVAAEGKRMAAFYSWEPLRDVTRPGSLVHAEHLAYRGDPQRSDHRTLERALPFVANDAIDVTFLYLGSIDEVGHDHGWMSDRYRQQVDLVDTLLQRLLDALHHRLATDTTVLLLADHGGHDRSHGTECAEDMTVPFFVAGPHVPRGVPLDGDVSLLDVAPTVAAALHLPVPAAWEGRDVAPGRAPVQEA